MLCAAPGRDGAAGVAGAGGTGPALPCTGAVLALLPVLWAQEKKAAELAAGLASSWGTGASPVEVRSRTRPWPH